MKTVRGIKPRKPKRTTQERKAPDAQKRQPLSLYPLSFDEAVTDNSEGEAGTKKESRKAQEG